MLGIKNGRQPQLDNTWPTSLRDKANTFTHHDVQVAIPNDDLSDDLLQALETLHMLGTEDGREAIMSVMSERGAQLPGLPDDSSERELALRLYLADVGPPQPLFVEVKSYGGKRQGGVGFGNGRGEGPQVDLLVGDASALFDSYIRWAFVDATQPVGVDRYAFLTCSDARAAVMGVVARGKQNNFKLAALRPHFVGWRAFSEQFLEFFASARGRR